MTRWRLGLSLMAVGLALLVVSTPASACRCRRARCRYVGPPVVVMPCAAPLPVLVPGPGPGPSPGPVSKPAPEVLPKPPAPVGKPPAPVGKPPAPVGKPPEPGAAGPLEFKEFTSEAGRFAVLMPGKPQEHKQTINKIDNYAFSVEAGGGRTFAVSYFDLPPTLTIPADKAVAAYAGGRKGKVTNEKKVTLLDEYPGREADVELPNGSVSRIRVFTVKQRQYQVIVDGPAAFVHSPDADKYFNSFKVED
jgi:hypothetical protein